MFKILDTKSALVFRVTMSQTVRQNEISPLSSLQSALCNFVKKVLDRNTKDWKSHTFSKPNPTYAVLEHDIQPQVFPDE